MAGPDKGERWTGILTALLVGVLFFVGGSLLGLGAGVLLILLAITALATIALFVLS